MGSWGFYSPRILVAIILLGACTLRTPRSIAAQIDDHLEERSRAESFSGSVLIAQDGQILLDKGYGFANQDLGVPNTPQTRYRIHWLSMPVSAIAILMLQADGKLRVDQKICQYVPDCPGSWQEITIHHLLTHTSGISDRIQVWTDRPVTTLDVITHLGHEAPFFTPGEQFRYSNNGYLLLGFIIEKASGSGYENFIRRNIFEPLEMDHSGLTGNGLAVGYNKGGTAVPPPDLLFRYSASGLYSSVADLFRLDQALYGRELISDQEKLQMFTGYIRTPSVDIEDADYGYGWFVGKILGRRVLAHGGMMSGYTSMLLRFPDERVTIIVLRNAEIEVYDRLEIELAKLVFGE